MVRLSDLPVWEREHMLAKNYHPFATQPWVDGPPLTERRVALITTAGLHRREDPAYTGRTGAYRVIPGDIVGNDLVMSHTSVNFDRTGFQQDVNVVFPIDRLRELAAVGAVGSLATYHYSFMGAAVDPEDLEPTAREVAARMRDDRVSAVVLIPV